MRASSVGALDMKVTIVDYGAGNLFNVVRAFQFLESTPHIVTTPKEVQRAERLVLPGVGAFGPGMTRLQEQGLVEPLREFAARGRPLLGVCLGMQLLLSESEEHGTWSGLDIIPGSVVRINPGPGWRVPHMGWNSVEHEEQDRGILRGIRSGSDFYFVHSYCGVPAQPDHRYATSLYGESRFCVILGRDNVVGVQFHPERSGETGLRVLRNFLAQ
jgi:imidazole glycerol-phosphate synthase subunit HisH